MTEERKKFTLAQEAVMAEVEAALTQAQRSAPQVSPDFMARIAAQGAAMQPQAVAARPVEAVTPPVGFWAALAAAIGGWPTMSGLALATIAGVWIGAAPPDSLTNLASSVLGAELGSGVTINLLGDNDLFELEG
ncbi:MAG: hypothetical protein JKX69_04285 [Rhodobacteraceae bacterium]|nr:hypothetical protein [Paracoccaceae bacterium]